VKAFAAGWGNESRKKYKMQIFIIYYFFTEKKPPIAVEY